MNQECTFMPTMPEGLSTEIDETRHAEVYSALQDPYTAHVIGVGAVGSHLVYHLVKLGFRKIVVYDFDAVEAHNVGNQYFFNAHIGMQKVEAISRFLNGCMGAEIVTPVDVKVESINDLQLKGDEKNVVFLLVDTIQGRQDIMEELEMRSDDIKFVIETRMAVSHHETFLVDLAHPTTVQEWEKSLPAEDVYEEVSACGSSLSVAATADNLATSAIWQMIHAIKDLQSSDFMRRHSLRDGYSSVIPTLNPPEPETL